MPYRKYYISQATDRMVQRDIKRYVQHFAEDYDINPDVIDAIIHTESGGNFNVIRYEPHLQKAGWYLKWLRKEERQDPYCFCSYGLMQVMFAVARSYGFKGSPFQLMDPQMGIAYGSLHLRTLLRRYQSYPAAISAYNQGTPRKAEEWQI